MKIKVICILVCICIFGGCKKENVCNNMPDGHYDGYFWHNGSSQPKYIHDLTVKNIDAYTISISQFEDKNCSANKDGCNVSGPIIAYVGYPQANLKIDGEILLEDGEYKIKGRYSYDSMSPGLGNPYRQYYEVVGTFEIKQ